MKIALCSDLHLEFGALNLKNDDNADVLILSGDVLVAADLKVKPDSYGIVNAAKYERYKDFFDVVSKEFPHVVYIAGNHEHYHHEFSETFNVIRDFVISYGNVHFLEKEFVEIDGVRFIGGTLWTDMNNDDENTHHHVGYRMNDFRIISNGTAEYKRDVIKRDEHGKVIWEDGKYIVVGVETGIRPTSFKTTDAYREHKLTLRFIEQSLRPDGRNVVVGHHAPSKRSTKPKYQHDTLMNGGYSSNLEDFINQHPGIILWTHGHTHDKFDYFIGNTRVVCNPRGYEGYEESARDFKLMYLEV